MPEPILMILGMGLLQRIIGLNTTIKSTPIEFIIQSGATWRKTTTRFLFSATVAGISA